MHVYFNNLIIAAGTYSSLIIAMTRNTLCLILIVDIVIKKKKNQTQNCLQIQNLACSMEKKRKIHHIYKC